MVAPSFDSLEMALRDSGSDAAGAHGKLCGLTCLMGMAARPSWLAEVFPAAGDSSAGDEVTATLLDALATDTSRSLEARDMAFMPLLPEDEEPLAVRADSLARWCEGFNQGLAQGERIMAMATEAEGQPLRSGLTGEIVQDFGEMANVAFGEDESENEGETAYAELVEYVRVCVQLVFEEFADFRDRLSPHGPH